MTTITVKIVSQLTGDLEFNSPQTLVAFALGLTLFVFTLGAQHLRALHRAQIPGAVRMTDRRHGSRYRPGRTRDPAPSVQRAHRKRRYAAERRFRLYGIAAISFGLAFLAHPVRHASSRKGYTAFVQSAFTLDVDSRSPP